jgi:alanine-glyoxylate transaminase / serine-glyoxylate transaminase / serine-pyruvate transaminase
MGGAIVNTLLTSRIDEVRESMDRAGHPALLMVDTISSLGCIDYRHDEWRVDVSVGGSQKGLMLPPGLGFNAVSQRALETARSARLPRVFWSWQEMAGPNKNAFPSAVESSLGLSGSSPRRSTVWSTSEP